MRKTLNALQKLFLLRSCTDGFFNTRDRPCLLYQIRRCSAPCVDRIDQDGYAELVADARDFLMGKSTKVQAKLGEQMQAAAENLDFELAAVLRDRLKALTFIQGSQAINAEGVGDADIFALACKQGVMGIQAFFIRGGQNWGHRAFFPAHTAEVPEEEVLAQFLMQFYEEVPPPRTVLLDRDLSEAPVLAEALCERAGFKVEISRPQRGARRKLMEQAQRNAVEALDRRLAESTTQAKILRDIADLFGLAEPPDRIEVYDNSHIQGTNAVGAMIVAGPEGFRTGQYRKFNIRSAATDDDFAMMREVFTRRFSRAQEEDPDRDEGVWPDLVLIDGGRGQINAARAVLEELGIEDVHAGVLPNEKAEVVRRLQRDGRVAMVGDGSNDAPSLMQADVGVAMGAGTDIAIESADVVIVGNRLSSILTAREISRFSYRKTKQNVTLAFLFNGIGIPAAATGLVYPVWGMVAMAASVTTIFINSLWGRGTYFFEAIRTVGQQPLAPATDPQQVER